MTTIWNWLRAAIATIGAGLGYFLGACDGFLYALIAFVVMDYITGIMCAIVDKKLSSAIGFKGIFRKVLIFVMVGIGHTLDMQILGGGDMLRTAVIFFYCANKGLSILENSGHLGLPIPEKLKKVLEQLHNRSDESENDKEKEDDSDGTSE